MDEALTLYMYLHTHWDREWYWSFAGYRTQLVTVVKRILHLLESGALNNFVLDGQTALIEDVLEVSPELEGRLKKLIGENKLFIGPWYVLADQMLVGGESLVRNLHYGLQICDTFGGASRVGYCPDTFGHSADLPRILRGFSIESAVVWRGVPALKMSPLFDWRSPDGSEVLALSLTQGYYQSAFGENLKPEALAAFIMKYLDLAQDASGRVNVDANSKAAPTVVREMLGALLPVGADHVGPQADFKQQLKDALALINVKDVAVRPKAVSLDQFFTALQDSAVPKFGEARRVIESELRDNKAAFEFGRAYMLDGVLSTRLYLKRDNRLAEYKMLRQAEPFRALLAVHNVLANAQDELNYNWKLLLKNHPHDSICGCSIDSVHREMLTRTEAIHDGLNMLVTQGKEAILHKAQEARKADRADVRFGARHLDVVDPALPFDNVCVFNPTADVLRGPVRLRLAREIIKGKVADVALPKGFQQVSAHKGTETFIGLSQVPVFKDIEVVEGFIDAGEIAGMTLRGVDLKGEGPDPATRTRLKIDTGASGALDQLTISNEAFSVQFDKEGNLLVGTADGASRKLGHRFVDVGDAGDTYNFDPVANDEPINAKLISVRPGVSGPLVVSMIAHYQIDLPEGLVAKGSLKKEGEAEQAPDLTVFERAKIRVPHTIETEIILKKDVPVVFFETKMDHKVADHRLEVVFDMAAPVEHTLSENHYSLIKRYHDKKAELHPLTAADELITLGHEAPLTRYPSQRFFVANGEGFYNNGLPEYGVGGDSVSITLLRAVSYLSRTRLRTRGGGAGPIIPTPEANCHGLMKCSYGWSPLVGAGLEAGLEDAAAYALADRFEADPVAFISPGPAEALTLFSLDNTVIRVCATYIDDENRLVIRLLNAGAKAATTLLTMCPALSTVLRGAFDAAELKAVPPFEKATSGNKYELQFEHYQTMTLFCPL